MENNVNFSDNPQVMKVDSVLGVIVEHKKSVIGKDVIEWDEYSLVVEVMKDVCLRVLIKPDSKQMKLIEQFGAFKKVSNCPWLVK